MASDKGFFHKLKSIFRPRWFVLDFAKITAWPSFPIVFRTKRYYQDPALKKRRIRGAGIVLANHTCFWDPVVIIAEFFTRRLRFIISKGLYCHNRLLAWMLDRAGCIVVDKEQFNLSSLAEMVDLLEDGGVLGIFPEGRISDDGELLPFKEGVVMIALRTGAPIYPVALIGDERLSRRKVVMHGAPIYLREACGTATPSLAQVKELAAGLHEKMAALLAAAEALEAERLAKKAAKKRHRKKNAETANPHN